MAGMRRRNWRAVIGGSLVFVLTGVFVLMMFALGPQSSAPAAMMAIVGATSGVVGGLSLLVMMHGLVGTKIREGRYATYAGAVRR